MNHQLWTRVGTRVLAIMFVVAGAAACGERDAKLSANTKDTTTAGTSSSPAAANGDSVAARAEHSGLPSDASPSAVVIGTAPAQPQGDTPETTPSSAAQSQLSKASESQSMPREGDNHSYSTTDPNSPQKAGASDPAAQRSQ